MLLSMVHLVHMGHVPDLTPAVITAMAAAASPWKLYHNPHFLSDSLHDSPHLLPYETPSSPPYHNPVFAAMADLTIALAEIGELRAKLEHERRMRRASESLAKSVARELAEERRARAEAEAEAVRCREAAGRAVKEAEEERRMLKLAEAWREERVHMKLADAAIVLEERMREVVEKGIEKASEVDCVVSAQHGRERQGREVENPHIKRGIKGFVEFSRAFRVRSPGSMRERERAGGDLECQRAQFRILLRQRNTVDLGMMADAQNLVM